jgi:hypothetical protein
VEKTYRHENFKYEYVSLKTEMLTEKAELEISFPSGYPVELKPGVFFGDESRDDATKLIEPGDYGSRKTESTATFVINKPLVGFNYHNLLDFAAEKRAALTSRSCP